jgi:hypothetical protein
MKAEGKIITFVALAMLGALLASGAELPQLQTATINGIAPPQSWDASNNLVNVHLEVVGGRPTRTNALNGVWVVIERTYDFAHWSACTATQGYTTLSSDVAVLEPKTNRQAFYRARITL